MVEITNRWVFFYLGQYFLSLCLPLGRGVRNNREHNRHRHQLLRFHISKHDYFLLSEPIEYV